MARYIRTNYTKQAVMKGVQDFTLKQARKQSQALFSTVNKRIDRIIASGQISPAVEGLIRSRGESNLHFTSGGKDADALSREWAQAVAFYNLETGTLAGARNFTNHLKDVLGDKVTDKDYVSDVFDLMHGVAERLPVQLAQNMIGTNEILNEIIESAVDEDLSTINASADSRESFIADAVKKMTDMIDDVMQGGIRDLDSMLASAQSRLY